MKIERAGLLLIHISLPPQKNPIYAYIDIEVVYIWIYTKDTKNNIMKEKLRVWLISLMTIRLLMSWIIQI